MSDPIYSPISLSLYWTLVAMYVMVDELARIEGTPSFLSQNFINQVCYDFHSSSNL